jgi:Flp pilus assembly protein TadG
MIRFRAFSGQHKDIGNNEGHSPKRALNKGLARFIAHFGRIRTPLRDFRVSTRGNVAVLSAVLALPMVTAVGCVVDYTMAAMIRTKLQAAADAGTIATISSNSPVTTAAINMSGSGSVPGGSTYALNFLNADLANIRGYTNL